MFAEQKSSNLHCNTVITTGCSLKMEWALTLNSHHWEIEDVAPVRPQQYWRIVTAVSLV